MCKVIAIANQKGGVGKTTTTSNLGIGLAKQEKRVLLIDADAQGSLTASLGIREPDRLEITLATIMASIINDEEIKPEYGILRHEEGKSTLMIFERHANLKYKYGNRHFGCRGYYVDTVGKNVKKIQEYIQNQLKEDLEYDQMSLKEYIDPFMGEPVKSSKLR